MTHAQLVDAAVAWLRRGIPGTYPGSDPMLMPMRCRPVFAETIAALVEQPDAIGWYYGLSHVVECKATRADFFADRRKPHAATSTSGMGRYRWYLTPAHLVEADDAPAWCGLAYALPGGRIAIAREAPLRSIDETAQMGECIALASAVRRHALGVLFDEKRGRFETVDEHKARRAG